VQVSDIVYGENDKWIGLVTEKGTFHVFQL